MTGDAVLRCRGVVLRDMRLADIDDHVRWFCTPMDWQRWDAPWENTAVLPNPARKRGRLLRNLRQPLREPRVFFEIEGPDGTHLGWTNRYRTGPERERVAIGIALPDLERGGAGVGTTAFALHAAYRFARDGLDTLHAETWSGNLRMIGLARRVGFEDCGRDPGSCLVRGRAFDGLDFLLRREALRRSCPWLEEAEGL